MVDSYRIDPAVDQLVAVGEVPELVEKQTHWCPTSGCVQGWLRNGVDGVRLPSVRWGGRRYTSREAIAWWLAHVNAADTSANGAQRGGV